MAVAPSYLFHLEFPSTSSIALVIPSTQELNPVERFAPYSKRRQRRTIAGLVVLIPRHTLNLFRPCSRRNRACLCPFGNSFRQPMRLMLFGRGLEHWTRNPS